MNNGFGTWFEKTWSLRDTYPALPEQIVLRL